jgi:hypothetical protein
LNQQPSYKPRFASSSVRVRAGRFSLWKAVLLIGWRVPGKVEVLAATTVLISHSSALEPCAAAGVLISVEEMEADSETTKLRTEDGGARRPRAGLISHTVMCRAFLKHPIAKCSLCRIDSTMEESHMTTHTIPIEAANQMEIPSAN